MLFLSILKDFELKFQIKKLIRFPKFVRYFQLLLGDYSRFLLHK